MIPEFVSSTDGVQVHLEDFGGQGPLLILSHATGFCGGAWAPFAAALSDHFHCVALDYRSHGRSTLPAGVELDWSGMGHDLLSVIDVLSPDEPARVVGHSMGGAAIVLADALRPGAVASAYAFEPILIPRTVVGGEPSPLVASARRRRPTFGSRAEALERYGSRPPLSLFDPAALEAYVEHGFGDDPEGTVTLRCAPEHEAQVFEHAQSGAFEILEGVGFPFLIAVSGDGGSPAQAAAAAVPRNERFVLAEYPDLTHFGPLQAPARIAADVLAWFTGPESPGRV